MLQSQEMIRAALDLEGTAEPNVQPAILANQNIELSRVAELTSCYLNDSWAPKIKEHLENGFVVFRIQTELGLNGHETMVYLAKMKAN